MSELNSHPIHGSRNKCINCGHEIYYLNDHWEHNTRYYKAHGFPFTTKTCYAKGDVPYGGYTYLEDGSMVRPTCCGCEAPEPKYPNDGLTIIISLPETASIDSDSKRPIIPLDELTKICGFFSTDSNVNNYYNCKHPKCRDGDDDEETGKWVGACTSFNCPLANDYESEDYKNVDGDHRMVIHDPETISKLSDTKRMEVR